MESLIAGMACKLYDDLHDNPLLKLYKNRTFMEALKIIHAIFFTMISLKDSTFFYLFFFSILLNFFSNPFAYKNSYEQSMLWVYPLLFFYMKKPTGISKLDLYIISLFLITNVIESYYSQEEYSYVKCIIRLNFFLTSIVCFYITSTLHNLMVYFIGYFGISFLVQLYSTKIKNKKKHSSFSWLNKWLASLDDRLECWFMKSKTDRKTIHYTYK
jgi:hypothetical protein